jgi:ubiquinone/menaquinone biosynthesis C-methylase UbiE
MKQAQPWYETAFEEFRPLFSLVSKKTTEAEVRHIMRKLNLKRGSRFLDCPCGIGRISLPLAKRGVRVTGVDLTETYLEEAAHKILQAKLPVKLVRSDMRRINFRNEFDAAGNLWTSFGYFEKESDNILVLKKLYQALKPGGRFVMQVINRDWVMVHYTTRGWEEADGLISIENRSFDFATSINHGEQRFLRDGKLSNHKVDLRMYSCHELIAMFKKVGFVDVVAFGGIKDEPITRNTRDMWLFATKPKRKG